MEPAVDNMTKRPILMALATMCAIFLFFLMLGILLNGGFQDSSQFHLGNKIAVVEVFGVIETSETIVENIKEFREDDSIKALILRIDSPGGGVAPSQEIFAAIKKTSEVKPVIASFGSVAASGGYYIAAPAKKIVANPGSLTGSIGVIMEFANYEDLLKKIGWRNEVVKSGRHKDIGSPIRPMTDADRKILQALIDDVHAQFVSAVAEGRQIDVAKVRGIADGRIFTGRQAHELGLVDELGGFEDAVDLAASLAGVEDPDLVYPKSNKPRLLDYFLDEVTSRFTRGLREESSLKLNYKWSGIR